MKKFKNQLKYVGEEINNIISLYISSKTYTRFQYYDNAAWQSRQRGNRTKIIIGRHDFLLLTKHKSDTQNWNNIAPRILENLPDFNVGKMSDEDDKEEEKRIKERIENLKIKNEEINNYKKEEKRMND